MQSTRHQIVWLQQTAKDHTTLKRAVVDGEREKTIGCVRVCVCVWERWYLCPLYNKIVFGKMAFQLKS